MHPNAQVAGALKAPQRCVSTVQVRSAPAAQYRQAGIMAGQAHSLTVQRHIPETQVELAPQVPPAQPAQVGVPHWHVGSAVPPSQVPLHPIVAPHRVVVLHGVP